MGKFYEVSDAKLFAGAKLLRGSEPRPGHWKPS